MFNVTKPTQQRPISTECFGCDTVIFETPIPGETRSSSQTLAPDQQGCLAVPASIYVIGDPARASVGDEPERTIARHQNGLSAMEVRWYGEAVEILRRRRQPCLFITVESHDDPAIVRSLIDAVKRNIATYQSRAGMRDVLWLEVIEGKCSDHAHILVPFPDHETALKRMETLRGSKTFGERVDVRLVTDWRWASYLMKEATPQAWFAHGKAFTRMPGSHPLAGGGDRVRVSRALDDMIIRQGRLPRRHRTNARRNATCASGELPDTHASEGRDDEAISSA